MLTDVLTDSQENKVHSPEQKWSDDFARIVTKRDFEQAEQYRTNNHDGRWQLSERLYYGAETQRYWEGTKIPRASLSSFVVFSQIQSLLPRVLSSLFADNPWFEVGPEPGTSGIQASRVRDLILYQMEKMRRFRNQSVWEVFDRAMTDGFLYGVSGIEICWLDMRLQMKKIHRQMLRPTDMMESPYGMVPRPTGPLEMALRQQTRELRWQQPYLKHISAKDIYVDQNHTNPQFQDARFINTRGYMTVDELLAKKGQPGFKIPSTERLIDLARNKPIGMGDQAKANAEQSRGSTWNPGTESTIDPGGNRLEVITRWQRDRCVWLVNREEVVYNAVNEYGIIPVFNMFYVRAPGRCYGLSVADVTEGEHRLQSSTINARIDEMAIHIHGRTVKKKGQAIPATQLRRKPGQVIEAEHPKEDIVFDQINPALNQAFLEVNASELRTQKIVGVNDLIGSGAPTSGGNSANRTAAGINTQSQAAYSRLGYIVENVENNVVEPLLSAWHYLNTQFLDPEQVLHILGNDGRSLTIDPLEILNADVVFAMRASSKMKSRQALMSVFPMISQAILHPQLNEQLHRMGKTFDLEEFFDMMLDISGWKQRGRFVRALTPQEQQALRAAAQQEQNVELVKQRERMEAMKELQDMKSAGELQKEIVGKGLEAALQPEEPESDAD